MRTDNKVAVLFKRETCQNIGRINFWAVVTEHLEHGAAGFDHPVRSKTLTEKVLSRNATVGHVDVGGMVNDASIGFLWHALVKATVACLHVEDGDLSTLGGDHGQAAIGVAQDEHGLRPNISQYLVHRNNHIANRMRSPGAVGGAI